MNNQNNRNNPNNRNGNPNNKNNRQGMNMLIFILLLVAVLMFSFFQMRDDDNAQEISYDRFMEMVEDGEVKEVVIESDRIVIKPKSESEIAAEKDKATDESGVVEGAVKENQEEDKKSIFASEKEYYTGVVDDPNLTQKLLDAGVKLSHEIPDSTPYIVMNLLATVLPFVFLIGMAIYLMRGMSKGGGVMGIGKSNAKMYVEKSTGVTFKDVAGQDEAKESLQEVVDFLHNPGKYTGIGAKLPKGALLVGPPGTGKTLLAKAVAGEAKVPFFSISGSEFVEMFVGMGASKVRDLFKQASEKAPCIVFIDEIDTIGKKRDGNGMGGNDEREQTLNQLLTEMDGFDSNKGVVILAATNRPEILDPALLRPGRFDRRIPVNLPDLQGRIEILKVHSKDVKMEGDINFNAIAKATSGASGAELANIINEAALRAVRQGRDAVTQEDLEESVETVIAGYKRKNAVLSEEEKRIVAFHEIGHALVAAKQTNSAPVTKITIIPRTSGSLGYTMQVEEADKNLLSKEDLLTQIATLTGGREAEKLVFGKITTGASNDIERATKMARSMITQYGMSDQFGMVALETVNNQYLGGDTSLICSPATSEAIDKEVMAIIKAAEEKAYNILKENQEKLNELSAFLLEKETITGEEFMKILNS